MFSSKFFYFVINIGLMLAAISSFTAKAECSLTTLPATINIPDLTLSPSDRGQVGTVLYSVSLPAPSISYTCGNSVRSTWYSTYVRPEMSRTNIENVYETGIAGIGIRIKWPESRAQNAWVPGNFSCQGNCFEAADKIKIEFVQIGNAQSSTLAAGEIVDISVSADNAPQNKKTILTINLGTVTVNARSCSIYASNNNVDLGDYSLVDIKKTGFLGDRKDFTITLECYNPTSAKITFEAKKAWGMGDSVMENAGTSKNAYIKLFQKSGSRYTEKPLNSTFSFGSTSSFTGQRKVTYAGQMFFSESNRAQVTAGTVTANVVYTLTIN